MGILKHFRKIRILFPQFIAVKVVEKIEPVSSFGKVTAGLSHCRTCGIHEGLPLAFDPHPHIYPGGKDHLVPDHLPPQIDGDGGVGAGEKGRRSQNVDKSFTAPGHRVVPQAPSIFRMYISILIIFLYFFYVACA